MNLSELQVKDVISIGDGKKIGRIVDANISSLGEINYLIVEPKRFFNFFSTSKETKIVFKQITKIGKDVILVDIEK